jgi:quercetin dioxygenase-like cupin family protein
VQGQILQAAAGSGWICVEGGEPQVIRQGDVVWIPADERHWHSASADTFMIHTATSLGKTVWQEEVAEQDYLRAVR